MHKCLYMHIWQSIGRVFVRRSSAAQDPTCPPIPSSPQPSAVPWRTVLCQIEGGSWETALQRQQRQEGGTWCRLMSMRVNREHSDEKKHSNSTVMGSPLSGLTPDIPPRTRTAAQCKQIAMASRTAAYLG